MMGRLDEIKRLLALERQLSNEFLNERLTPIAVKLREADSLSEKISSEYSSKNFLSRTPWWVKGLELIDQRGNKTQFVESLKRSLEDRLTTFAIRSTASIVDRFRDLYGLRLVVYTELEKLFASRDKAVKVVKNLCKPELLEIGIVSQTISCRKCKRRDTEVVCPFCKAEVLSSLPTRFLD